MRVDFVANVTHEIKTPLTAILGFVETLQEGAIEDRETAKKFLSTIARHAERLQPPRGGPAHDLEHRVRRIRFLLRERRPLRGCTECPAHDSAEGPREEIELTSAIPEDLPLISADRDRLSQILINVLDNAVKFTPEGGTVTLSAAQAAGNGSWLKSRTPASVSPGTRFPGSASVFIASTRPTPASWAERGWDSPLSSTS